MNAHAETRRETTLGHAEARAIAATGDPHAVVRLVWPDATDEFAAWFLATHTGFPATLDVDSLVEQAAAATDVVAQDLVVVDCDGLIGLWHPKVGFSGDHALVAAAREAAYGHYPVEWGRLDEVAVADATTPRGALTALMYHRPGRTRITEWPDRVREWWETHHHVCG